MKLFVVIPIALILFPCLVSAQDSISIQSRKYIKHIAQSSADYEKKVSDYSQKVLLRFSKEERKIKKKLQMINPQKANELFSDTLQSLATDLKKRIYSRIPSSGYLDTTQLSLQFLKNNGITKQYLDLATRNQEALQGKLQFTETLQSYIQERRKLLREQLMQYPGFSKNFRRLGKQTYYYKRQLEEYKSIYEHPSKIERKVVDALRKLPVYNDFIKNNSLLGSVFNLPSDYNSARSLEGLQTRSQVEQIVQRSLGSDIGARATVSQQMEQARNKLAELKGKFPDLQSPADMPDFKPNSVKTKSFLKRLEYGGNIQFQKNTSYYPTTGDIAGQVGYKFHDNGTTGFGVSYKLGLGNGWNHIAFSSEGVGLRFFIDWKLRGTFYLAGGFEENYITTFNSFQQLYKSNVWKRSALLGVSKKYKINAKLKGNLMLLYDFLAHYRNPQTDRIKIRIGYTL